MNIDYGDLIFSKRLELDKKAYAKYYNDYFDKSEFDEGYASVMADGPLTFNSWYGSDLHKRYVQLFLRKQKLKKIDQNKNTDY